MCLQNGFQCTLKYAHSFHTTTTHETCNNNRCAAINAPKNTKSKGWPVRPECQRHLPHSRGKTCLLRCVLRCAVVCICRPCPCSCQMRANGWVCMYTHPSISLTFPSSSPPIPPMHTHTHTQNTLSIRESDQMIQKPSWTSKPLQHQSHQKNTHAWMALFGCFYYYRPSQFRPTVPDGSKKKLHLHAYIAQLCRPG
jgi:hypothetical protein